jgi:uncharacterized protein
MDSRALELGRILTRIGPCLVAFSGGVDSTLLLRVARDHLGDGAVAVTALSPSFPEAERVEAAVLARRIGARQILVETREMEDPLYLRNDGARCFACKRELFAAMSRITGEAAGRAVVYGAILDDLGEERPGMRAAAQAGARAPLLEAGFDKAAVRRHARELGLPNWDKPAMACLASRLPRLTPVTAAGLAQVERAEASLHALGYRQVRVRHLGHAARVELDAEGLRRSATPSDRWRLVEAVRGAGYREVMVDPRGYRPGGADAPPPG